MIQKTKLLSKNKLIALNTKHVSEILKKNPLTNEEFIESDARKQALRKVKLTENEVYARNIFNRIQSICETIEDMELTLSFLGRFPYRDQKNISRSIYIKYHIEHWFFMVGALRDRYTLLVNDTYELGLPDRDATPRAIFENLHTKNTNTVKHLKIFDKSIQGIISSRNKIAHNQKYSDDGIDQLSIFEVVHASDHKLISDKQLKLLHEMYRKRKIPEIKENIKSLCEFTEIFFDNINKEYILRINKKSRKQEQE